MVALKLIAALWNDRHSESVRNVLREAIAQAQGEKYHESHRKSFYSVKVG